MEERADHLLQTHQWTNKSKETQIWFRQEDKKGKVNKVDQIQDTEQQLFNSRQPNLGGKEEKPAASMKNHPNKRSGEGIKTFRSDS